MAISIRLVGFKSYRSSLYAVLAQILFGWTAEKEQQGKTDWNDSDVDEQIDRVIEALSNKGQLSSPSLVLKIMEGSLDKELEPSRFSPELTGEECLILHLLLKATRIHNIDSEGLALKFVTVECHFFEQQLAAHGYPEPHNTAMGMPGDFCESIVEGTPHFRAHELAISILNSIPLA